MGTEYPDAVDLFVDRSRVFAGMNSHSAIVLHCTGGGDGTQTAQQLGNYFRDNDSGTSTHFGIDRAGVVAQYVRLGDGAAGNCCVEAGHDPFWDDFLGANLNPHTISIECVNDVANSLPLTEPQKAALFKLVAWLCQRYGLGADQVKTHQSIAPGSRARCPGGAFPLTELLAFIKAGGTSMLELSATHGFFVDGGNSTWLCKTTGKKLWGAILRHYRENNGLPRYGLPLIEETKFPEYPGAIFVLCERGIIAYDPGKKYDNPPGSGHEYAVQLDSPVGRKFLQAPLLAEIATLKQEVERLKNAAIPPAIAADIKLLSGPMARLIAAAGLKQ